MTAVKRPAARIRQQGDYNFDIVAFVNNEIAKVGGVENYIDINVAQAPDCFPSEMVSEAKAKLLRIGIGITEIDKTKVKAINQLLRNSHYRSFNEEEVIYTIENAKLLSPTIIANRLKKDILLVQKIVRKINELVI